MEPEQISDDKFIARLEARNADFERWAAHRANARAKLIELGLTGQEVDSILDGPQWATGENTE